MGTAFANLAAEGKLRPGLTQETSADIAWAFASPHQYEYLVIERGWSVDDYRPHLEETIASRLLMSAT
jgi:hypothetical protein